MSPFALRTGLLAAGLFAIWTSPSMAAKIYQYTNAAGETVFTDEPTEGATVHDVDPAPVIPMERVEIPETDSAKQRRESTPPDDAPATGSEPPPKEIRLSPEEAPEAAEPSEAPAKPESTEAPAADYGRFAIESPSDGEMASRPRGSITVELELQPALRSGDRINVLVDGEPRVRDTTGRRHLLDGLTPGRHVLTAQIRRDDTVVRETRPVEFTLIVP
ncbi:MAG: DUF4124 domain-containing protein [Pseudomonadota bacterium]